MPRIVRELIARAIRSRAELALVASLADEAALQSATRQARPDVVVVGGRGAVLPDGCRELLDEQPRLLVVALDVSVGHAYVHAAGGAVRSIPDVDPHSLAALISDITATRA
jgi:DNA-binding NarL/FixJ family response regulator